MLDYNPEHEEGYLEWEAYENAQDDAKFDESWKMKVAEEEAAEAAENTKVSRAIEEVVAQDTVEKPIEEPVEEPVKPSRKRTKASLSPPTMSQQSPRKQRKVLIALPIQEEVSFSSSPDDFQIVQAGRARRVLEQQLRDAIRDEQSLIDRQLVSSSSSGGGGGGVPRDVVVVSSSSDGE